MTRDKRDRSRCLTSKPTTLRSAWPALPSTAVSSSSTCNEGGEATNKELGDLFASDAGATRAIILGQRIRQRHFGVNHKGVNRVVVRYVFPGASKVANKPQRLECLLTRGVLAASVYLKCFAAKPH